ncbi:MAG: hypothetical protein M1826_000975, partial [Phylliscum demangeonii]
TARRLPLPAASPPESFRLRGRAASATPAVSHQLASFGHPIEGSVPEESDYAVDEGSDGHDRHAAGPHAAALRRFSEFAVDPDGRRRASAALEHRQRESVQQAAAAASAIAVHGAVEGAQSRRHSFADLPARYGVTASPRIDRRYAHEGTDGEDPSARAAAVEAAARPWSGEDGEHADPSPAGARGHAGAHPHGRARGIRADGAIASAYAAGVPHRVLRGGPLPPPRVPSSLVALPAGYPSAGTYGVERSSSPPGGRPRHAFGPPHPVRPPSRPHQALCVVTFKCCRAEVFYVHEGTGLQVKAGDMVIVEADRGTDLGTVVEANLSPERARDLKEHYAAEHYRWLMMFSRHHNAGTGHGHVLNGVGPYGARGAPGSAVGGMGPPGGHHAGPETGPGDLKPKMIKRLAQAHEIQTLRDKEGNEAKAKRVCQQKVAEHRLQMEILDAEFQMDWKKLTFYYFADAYINFNSLVTELFKVYKTRIWMSAINPASFANLGTGGPSPTTGLGPASVPFGRQSPYRPPPDASLYHGGGPAAFNGLRAALLAPPSDPSGGVPDRGPPLGLASNGAAGYAFPAFGPIPRGPAGLHDYLHRLPRPLDPPPPVDYRPIGFSDVPAHDYPPRPSHPHHHGAGHKTGLLGPGELWMGVGAFQSLSLNTH